MCVRERESMYIYIYTYIYMYIYTYIGTLIERVLLQLFRPVSHKV